MSQVVAHMVFVVSAQLWLSAEVRPLIPACVAISTLTEFTQSVKHINLAMQLYMAPLAVCGGLSVIILLYLFVDTAKHVLLRCPSGVKTATLYISSVYPVVGLATLIAMLVPRSQLLMEAVTQAMVMTGFYQLFCLFVTYAGGELKLFKELKPTLNMRIPPCCCYPCCNLPTGPLTKKKMDFLRCLVLQLPVIQITVYIIKITLWIEDKRLYEASFNCFLPFVIVSIITGIWGINMLVGMLKEPFKECEIVNKLLAHQLVLLCSNLQGAVAKQIGVSATFPCILGLAPVVICYDVYYMVLIVEMVLLSLWVRKLYTANRSDEAMTTVVDGEDCTSCNSDNVMYIKNITNADRNNIDDKQMCKK